VRDVDRVVVVVDESAERIASMGIRPEKIFVFSNVDDTEVIVPWKGSRDPFTVAYAGGFGPHRGIDTLIGALPALREAVPGARLVLMGRGSSEPELKALAERLGVADAVEWTGWVDADEMRARLADASVGAVPHRRNEHTDSTVPHKLFQYMGMGLPVTVTDCAPLARIVAETGAGTVAKAGDSADLARKLAELADPERSAAASEAGRTAVAERYNLKTEGENLVRLYSTLGPRRG
jgi:glycosyltransferase involved in cell wall biosynthesis